MNPALLVLQNAIVGGAVLGVATCLYGVIRADLRENPAKAPMPMPWHGIEAIRSYIATVKFDPDVESEDDGDEPVDLADPGAAWDRARDRQIARELGVA